jgi:hypothetical protein
MLGEATMTSKRPQRTKEAAKAEERQPPTPARAIYSDSLLRVSVVVETGGELWICPRRPGGWSSRQRLVMTDGARSQRLQPARDVGASWLGIDADADREVCARTSADDAA